MRSIATFSSRVRKRWRGRAPTASPSKACSSIRSATSRPALPAGRAAARRADESDKFGFGRGLHHELRAGAGRARATPSCGRTTAAARDTATRFLRDVVGSYFHNMHTDVIAGVDALVRQGVADPDRLARDGLERGRAPHQQADHDHRPVQGRIRQPPGAANWISMFAQTDTRRAGARGSAARRGRPTRRSTSSGTTRR